MTPGAFGYMSAALTGAAPPALPTPAETAVYSLVRASEILRASGDPAVLPVAQAFESCLQDGGNLPELLGLKVGRGKRNEVPHTMRRRQAMVALLRELVADEHGRVADARQAGRLLALVMAKMPIVATVIRESSGVARVPTSEKALISLMRGAES